MDQIAAMEVGISVIDLPKMQAFYTHVLGCEEVRRADIPAPLSDGLRLAADGYVCIWLQTPRGEVIKLMSPPAAPERLCAPEYLTSRTGIAYLTFYVSDISGVLATAQAEGALLRSDPALLAENAGMAVKLGFFSDPEGNIIELVEPTG